MAPSIVHDCTTLVTASLEKMTLQLYLTNTEGKISRKIYAVIYEGLGNFVLDMSGMAAGIYYVNGTANGIRMNPIKLIKL